MEKETKDFIYKKYAEWKQWNGDSPFQSGIYKKELSRLNLNNKAKIVEFGFGDGHFLDWAKDEGYDVAGVDRVFGLVENARKKGHRAYCSIKEMTDLDKVDLIIAFDVFEHLEIEEAIALIEDAKSILKPQGLMMLRVPNTASPFGLEYQNGDLTHVSQWSESRFHQLAIVIGIECISVSAAAIDANGGSFPLIRRFVFNLRDIHGYCLSYLYFGRKTLMSPSITAVFKFR
jgi:2-polyprenyl-3-methyl-5-hydroxy-6-metoxy-1,4-benzoquinol methylase